ncbi:hypothetical protein [Gilvimarinus sp. 1_MG-2023]|uniref:hypothetical protein n=1 Tax=Gilvimarinus sp. 1_MG-2023 TaxID=3062638 RepID=UPI0026E219AB|nr:hypothetical protein [Gilvimarinus sp. 1_MG-2023]MDO6746642.1 hypothetical protein [Gilvimarinus sp. 1_MG-2023]
MDLMKRFALMLVIALPLAACDNNDGAAEEVGQKLDQAAESTRDAAEDAADSIGDSAEDACEEVSGENC